VFELHPQSPAAAKLNGTKLFSVVGGGVCVSGVSVVGGGVCISGVLNLWKS
jgi:hypothetical protein